MTEESVGIPGQEPLSVEREEPLLPDSIQLGLWAPSLAQQGFGPFLLPDELERFQAHDVAISRLHIAHLITYSAHIAAREKLCKKIKKALRLPAMAGSSAKASVC